LAGAFDADELQLYYQIALQGRSDIGLAPDDYAGFSMTLLRMLAFAPEESRTVGRPAQPLAPVSVRAETPAAEVESKKNEGEPDWAGIVEGLGLSGMARMLAQHCELVRRDDSRIELALSKAHERLLDKPYQDKLKAALQQRFGAGVRVTITVGDGNGNSPAALADRDKQRRQAQAVAEIEQDPFVRELVENFDARIVEATIKPIQ
jgi:DNA polymerase-3 subunit gamma/tau